MTAGRLERRPLQVLFKDFAKNGIIFHKGRRGGFLNPPVIQIRGGAATFFGGAESKFDCRAGRVSGPYGWIVRWGKA